MKGKIKTKEQGITLIALVITIIVLLILAGVSIAMLTGENGILTQAQTAKENTEKASLIEQVQVDILGEQTKGNGSGISAGTLQGILDDYFTNVPPNANDIINMEEPLKSIEGNYDIPLSDIYTGEIIGEKEPIEVAESYVANFADMDGDGDADGIIYADLAKGGSGQWAVNGSRDWGKYSYEAETTGLKEYYIEEENYTDERFSGNGNVSGKLIAPIEGTSGKDRFYVMALEDINTGTRYCWYDAAYGKLDKTVATDYDDFGDGKENTAYVMDKWNLGTAEGGWGAQNDNGTYDDMWGVKELKDKVDEGWFVPSKDEWAAFGDMATKTLGLNTSNYSSYGLSDWYWSSSQNGTYYAYSANFDYGYIRSSNVDNGDYVRLSATF